MWQAEIRTGAGSHRLDRQKANLLLHGYGSRYADMTGFTPAALLLTRVISRPTPTHICPTVAMHQRAYVVEGGRLTGTWNIVGRDRVLSV